MEERDFIIEAPGPFIIPILILLAEGELKIPSDTEGEEKKG